MRVFFAPLEGLTDDIFRRTYTEFYGNVDGFYMPFFSPTIHRTLTPKESRELPLAASRNFYAVPQIMTKDPDDFIWASQQCADRGYTEVNLNAGCPSGTVFSKGKGAGLLTNKDHLASFLEKICKNSPIPVSVKTRIGVESEEEFQELLEIYNAFPLKKLIIHPRVRNMYYKGTVSMEQFQNAYLNSRNPIEYNGDIKRSKEIEKIVSQYPELSSVMIGRGLIRYPGMLSQNKDCVKLKQYHDTLLNRYIECLKNERNAMFRMKEHWFYILTAFENNEKLGKMLKKSTNVSDYKNITTQIFETLNYKPE